LLITRSAAELYSCEMAPKKRQRGPASGGGDPVTVHGVGERQLPAQQIEELAKCLDVSQSAAVALFRAGVDWASAVQVSAVPAPDAEKERALMEHRLHSFKRRINPFLESGGDLDDPTPALVDQMVNSLQAILLHASAAVDKLDVDACESTLEALASTLGKAERAEGGSYKECISDQWDFDLTGADGAVTRHFQFSFHRPILWVWRELLLAMLASGAPDEAVITSVRRCLLAPPLYETSKEWRTRPRHTLDLLLRGGHEQGWDEVDDHRKDARTC